MGFTFSVFEIEPSILVTVIAETSGFPFLQFCLMRFCCQFFAFLKIMSEVHFILRVLFLIQPFALFFDAYFLCKVHQISPLLFK